VFSGHLRYSEVTQATNKTVRELSAEFAVQSMTGTVPVWFSVELVCLFHRFFGFGPESLLALVDDRIYAVVD
jgi:hypothetical protein